MSYSFDRVMGALGKKPDDKVDLFGNSSSGSQQPTGLGLTSSTEGDLGPSGSDVASGTSGAKTAPSDVSSSAAYRSNVGKTKGPDLGALKTGVDAKNSALDAEANSYLDNRAALTPSKLSDTDVDQLHGAIDKGYTAKPTGDEPLPYFGGDVSNGTRDSLGYWSKIASGQVEKVDPFKSTLNLDDSTLNNLGTDAGMQNLLRQGKNAEYNIGDASFDQALLGQDQGFQRGRQDVMDSYRGLKDKQNTGADAITNRAQITADGARASYLSDLKAKLGGFQSQFTDEARAREKEIEDAATARQGELIGQGGDYAANRAQELAGGDPELSQYYGTTGVNPRNFITGTGYDANAQDWKSYLNDDQALRFNNIFSLLGSKDIYGKGKLADGFADSDLVNRDDVGLNAALQGAAKGRKNDDDAAAEAARQAAVAAGQVPPPPNPDETNSPEAVEARNEAELAAKAQHAQAAGTLAVQASGNDPTFPIINSIMGQPDPELDPDWYKNQGLMPGQVAAQT